MAIGKVDNSGSGSNICGTLTKVGVGAVGVGSIALGSVVNAPEGLISIGVGLGAIMAAALLSQTAACTANTEQGEQPEGGSLESDGGMVITPKTGAKIKPNTPAEIDGGVADAAPAAKPESDAAAFVPEDDAGEPNNVIENKPVKILLPKNQLFQLTDNRNQQNKVDTIEFFYQEGDLRSVKSLSIYVQANPQLLDENYKCSGGWVNITTNDLAHRLPAYLVSYTLIDNKTGQKITKKLTEQVKIEAQCDDSGEIAGFKIIIPDHFYNTDGIMDISLTLTVNTDLSRFIRGHAYDFRIVGRAKSEVK